MRHLNLAGVGLIAVVALLALAVVSPVTAQDADQIARGEYISIIAGCRDCHTPITETGELILDEAYSGGRPFDLGPFGIALSKNLTADEATGIGSWTDEELERNIRTGVTPDGLQNFPVMPYVTYNRMSDEDMAALIAFLRTLEPFERELPREQIAPIEALPQLALPESVPSPDMDDPQELGRYLVEDVMACTDCHTPSDPNTGERLEATLFLAGGQPFEGPWGVVYGRNLTPHAETGIGAWAAEDIQRAIRTGVRPDGRVLVVMPWVEYANLTNEDVAAIAYYLQNEVEATENEVPPPAFNEGFERFVDAPAADDGADSADTAADGDTASISPTTIVVGVLALIVAVVIVVVVLRGNNDAAKSGG